MAAQQAYPYRFCRSYADYRSVSHPHPSYFFILVLCCLLHSFLAPSILFCPVYFSASSLLKAPSGGFSYSGLQNSSHSQFSYSLSQGSRTRNPSSDVNEALYSLDRVLQGESAAYRHEGTACSSWVCFVRHIPFLSFSFLLL